MSLQVREWPRFGELARCVGFGAGTTWLLWSPLWPIGVAAVVGLLLALNDGEPPPGASA